MSDNVFKRLNAARKAFHASKLKKTGRNKFAEYDYFELGDFLVPALGIFEQVGLCGVISFTDDLATMRIVNVDDSSDFTEITSPMGSAKLKACHEVQNIGAVETYQRRYLWQTALEIVEHDAIEAKAVEVPPEEPAAPTGPINDKTRDWLAAQITSHGHTLGEVCNAFDILSLKDVTYETVGDVREWLTNNKKAA